MGGAIVTSNELVFTFEVLTSVPILVKIDQKCDYESAHKRAHTQTDRQTQTDFLICPMHML